jgi:protocatechuate 3,4-dioxygenase alpha subunit
MSARLHPTPGQTVGPFFHYALPYPGDAELVPASSPGAIRFHGHVLDGAGVPVPDALVEIWQADGSGTIVQQPGSLRRDGWTFTGWGRAATDDTGHFSFSTIAPGGVGGGAAFFALTVFARGLLDRLFTRAYLPGDEAVLAADP